jgi:hypothetical protein
LLPQSCVLGPNPTKKLLILLNIILQRVDLIFLHPPVAGNYVSVGVALTAAERTEREQDRSAVKSSPTGATRSRFVRAMIQDKSSDEICDSREKVRGGWGRGSASPQSATKAANCRAFNRKTPHQRQGEGTCRVPLLASARASY